jgi:RNA polymerase sigma-70 factor (ECF subfamily)
MSPQPLLPRIAAGHPDAVEEFLRRHTGTVYGLARRFCRTAQDAEDATQEIFVDVWRSAERYDAAAGSETTFLLTIARRRLIDRARREGRKPPTDALDDADALPGAAPAVDHALLDDEVRAARAAMERLRPEQRRVLDLVLGHGSTHQQVSASIGIPLGTVKSHARRGLLRLRELLGVEPAPGAGA